MRDLIYVIPEWPHGFPYTFQFKSEFCNKELMIWATVSSRSCFCWLYRASPSLSAKNIISLIAVLTTWWCPCVEWSIVLLEEGVCYDQCILLAKLYWPCTASFCTPRPNLLVTLGISWLPTFAFQSSVMKKTSFFFRCQIYKFLYVFIELFCFFGISGWGIDSDYCADIFSKFADILSAALYTII